MPKGVGYPSSSQHKKRVKLGGGVNENPEIKKTKKKKRMKRSRIQDADFAHK